MPSWVVPAVAAELWGVTVGQIMADVAAGRLCTRIEGELLFVDVDPTSTGPQQSQPDANNAPAAPAPYRRPLAWSFAAAATPLVTAAERDALLGPAAEDHAADDAHDDDGGDDDDSPPDDDLPPPMALTVDDIPNWDEVRARVARNRRPPGAREAA